MAAHNGLQRSSPPSNKAERKRSRKWKQLIAGRTRWKMHLGHCGFFSFFRGYTYYTCHTYVNKVVALLKCNDMWAQREERKKESLICICVVFTAQNVREIFLCVCVHISVYLLRFAAERCHKKSSCFSSRTTFICNELRMKTLSPDFSREKRRKSVVVALALLGVN